MFGIKRDAASGYGWFVFKKMTSANCKSYFLAALTVCLFVGACLAQDDEEYHDARGGFSVRLTSQYPNQSDLMFKLEQFTLLGTALTWKLDGSLFSIGYFNLSMSSRFAKNVNKAAVIDSWVNETQKQARTVNASLNRTTFTSGGFQGAELRSNINPLFVTRAFFHGELLIILNIRAKDQEELNDLLRVAGSFRALTKTERIIALIGEYTPDPLPLELPANLPPSDTTELHLHGMVKRVRESKEGKSPADRTFTHEINFDENGFVTSETSFVDGFPDVITAWGSVSGLRVNREISVAYPGGDGPRVGRRMVITGEVPFVLPDGNIYKSPNGLSVDVRYGTRFETKFDERRRPVQRNRFLNNGSLIFSQIFTYADGSREVKTSDVDGNFFSHFKYKLDEMGNVLEEQSLSDTGKILTATQFMYKYDASGNWIRKEAYQTQAFGSKPGRRLLGIYTRDLLYFDNSINGPVA